MVLAVGLILERAKLVVRRKKFSPSPPLPISPSPTPIWELITIALRQKLWNVLRANSNYE